MNKRLLFIIIFIITFLLSNTFENEAQNEDTAEAESRAYYLSLEDVSRLALMNNFDIQLAKFDTYIKRTDQDLAESIFDTVIDAEVKYTNDQQKRTSTILGSKEVTNEYNIGFTKKAPSGTTIGMDFENSRQWTDSSFATTNPAHDSSVKISIEQELGKNFFGIKDRGDIKITKIDIENTEYTSLDNIEETLAQAQKAYWKLVLSRELLQIKKEMLNQAEKLYSLHREKIKDGLIEEPELFASEANVRQRRTDLLLANNDVGMGIEELKLLLNINKDINEILPKDNFTVDSKGEALEDSLEKAFGHRRDYAKAENDIKSKNIKLTIKKNNLWPEINLSASFTRNGIDDHFSQAISQITGEDNPEYFLGLEISFPLENREAKSGFEKAKLEKAKTLITIKKIERVILKEIVDSVRNCQVLRHRYENQKVIAQLQEKKLREEEKRFNYGRSNTDTIIRYQEDVLNAKLLAAEAAYEYKAALIDLALKENTLLDEYWKDVL